MLSEVPFFLPPWWLALIQPLGLVSAWLARVQVGSRRQAHFEWAFFVLLAAVGFTTLAAAVTCPDTCVMTGTTLALMLMAVIWDFDKGKKALRR